MPLIPNPDALRKAREARSAFVGANSSTVNGYAVYPDAPPGVGWVVLGPSGTKGAKADRVKKFYSTKELAIAMAERLPTPTPPRETK